MGKPLALLPASSFKDGPSASGSLPLSKPMFSLSAPLRGLIGPFHSNPNIPRLDCGVKAILRGCLDALKTGHLGGS